MSATSSSSETAPGAVGGPGLLHIDPEGATLVFRRLLHHPIAEVWEAITDPKQVELWYMAKVARDSTAGTVEFQHPNELRARGRLLEWSPPRIYEYEWKVDPGSGIPRGENSVVRWELSPVEGGTLLVMTHRKLSRRLAETFVRGFNDFLNRLSAQLDGAPLPEPPWLSRARKNDPTVD
jgi:uncharacterized protein YndB with AHSA1/START domain